MPQAKSAPEKSREEATRAFVEVAFDDAYEIRESYTAVLERRRANREQLRSLAAQGHLDDEQQAELEELYPARSRASQESEEAAATPEPANA